MDELINNLLKEKGLEYDQLNYEEREWINNINLGSKGYSLGDLKDDLNALIRSMTLELTDTPDNESTYEKNRTLKARLKNYIVLHTKLSAPEQARKFLEKAMNSRNKNNGINTIL